jgi:putative FmdB family regulatory protein
MPLFEYTCNDCRSAYEILHKTRERVEEIECPSCGSKQYTKKFSTFAASMGSHTSHGESPCASGACGLPAYPSCTGGACGLN